MPGTPLFDRDEADFHPFVEGRGNPPEHREGVALVTSIFEPADDRRGRPHELGKPALSQPRFGTKVVNLSGHVGVGQLGLEGFGLRLVIADVAVIRKLKGLRGESAFPSHRANTPVVSSIGWNFREFGKNGQGVRRLSRPHGRKAYTKNSLDVELSVRHDDSFSLGSRPDPCEARPMLKRSVSLVIVAVCLTSLAAFRAQEAPRYAGATKTGFLLPNGWVVSPVGEQVPVADLPLNILPLPDSRHVLVATSGYNAHELSLIDLGKRAVVDRQAVRESWFGLTASPRFDRIWWWRTTPITSPATVGLVISPYTKRRHPVQHGEHDPHHGTDPGALALEPV